MNQILSNHDKDNNNMNNNKYHHNNYYNRKVSTNNYNRNSVNRRNTNNYGRYRNNNYNNIRNNSKKYNYYYQQNQVYEKLSLDTIRRVFAISIIVFALAIIGQSVYALNSNEYKPKDTPTVSIEKMGKEVTITIETQKPIKELKYRWNDDEESIVNGKDNNKIEETIDVPNGNNILNITVIDCYGNKTYYQRQYIYESSDITKPTVEISSSGTILTINVSDETKLATVTYKWNDEEEKNFEVPEGQNKVSMELEVMQGKNNLTITAIDGEDNRLITTKTIIGDTKPEISISTEGNNVVINAKDDEGIKKLEVTIDGESTEQETGNNKEINAKIPVSVGTHSISATVINVNGLKATKEITANI